MTASQTYLYIDGQLVGSNTKSAALNNSSAGLTIAAQLGHDRRTFQGSIDEVRIWSVARSQSQIESDRFRELTGMEAGLVAYWQFNEAQGATAFDLTANGNDALFQGAPRWVGTDLYLAPAEVPEPSVITLILGGALGLFLLRRRRSH